MKNLANCKPSEFFAQTVKIRKYAEDWLKVTDILKIRENVPKFEENDTDETKKKKLDEAVNTNIGKIFDSIFEEHGEKTLGLLALLCFIEPEHVDDYEVKDYLGSFAELLSCPEVVSFFISLASLGNANTSRAAKL